MVYSSFFLWQMIGKSIFVRGGESVITSKMGDNPSLEEAEKAVAGMYTAH